MKWHPLIAAVAIVGLAAAAWSDREPVAAELEDEWARFWRELEQAVSS